MRRDKVVDLEEIVPRLGRENDLICRALPSSHDRHGERQSPLRLRQQARRDWDPQAYKEDAAKDAWGRMVNHLRGNLR